MWLELGQTKNVLHWKRMCMTSKLVFVKLTRQDRGEALLQELMDWRLDVGAREGQQRWVGACIRQPMADLSETSHVELNPNWHMITYSYTSAHEKQLYNWRPRSNSWFSKTNCHCLSCTSGVPILSIWSEEYNCCLLFVSHSLWVGCQTTTPWTSYPMVVRSNRDAILLVITLTI